MFAPSHQYPTAVEAYNGAQHIAQIIAPTNELDTYRARCDDGSIPHIRVDNLNQ